MYYQPSILQNDPHPLARFQDGAVSADPRVFHKKKATHSEFQAPQALPSTRTLEPYVTGTSIIAIKYKDGVMMAGDTLVSYGSLARFRDAERIRSAGKFTVLGGTGDYSDFQYIDRMIDELIVEDEIADDGSSLSPKAIHSYLTRVMYNRRNKMDPLWNQIVVAGFKNGQSHLGLVDQRGTSYEDNTIATGYGAYIARPLLRSATNEGMNTNLTREEAQKLLEDCMRVLFYRDARAYDRIQLATVTADGITISDPYELKTDWTVGTIQYEGRTFNVKDVPAPTVQQGQPVITPTVRPSPNVNV